VAIDTPWWQTTKWQVNGGNQSNGNRAMADERFPFFYSTSFVGRFALISSCVCVILNVKNIHLKFNLFKMWNKCVRSYAREHIFTTLCEFNESFLSVSDLALFCYDCKL
jgi:hypothetical protein